MNKYALQAVQKDLPQIVPDAQLHCFESAESALAFAEVHGCDVLLTEIELWNDPHGGVRLAERIKELSPRVHIIFVTVCTEKEVASELSGLRIDGFLPKPWPSEALASVFRNLPYPVKPRTIM